MADEPAPVEGGQADGGEGGGENQPPSLDDRLNWNVEERGELPEEYRSVPLDDLRSYAEQAAQRARDEAQAEIRQRQAAQAAAQQREQAAAAESSEAIAFADRLDALRNGTEAEREEAQRLQDENPEKYGLGVYHRRQQQQASSQQAVLSQHYTKLMGELGEEHQGFLDSLEQRFADAGNTNPLLAAIEYGKELGRNEGSAVAAAQAEMRQQAEQGAQEGPPTMGNPSPPPAQNYGDPEWVDRQRRNDPEWMRKESGRTDRRGRPMTNAQVVGYEMAEARRTARFAR